MMTETMIWMERVRKRQGEISINGKQLKERLLQYCAAQYCVNLWERGRKKEE